MSEYKFDKDFLDFCIPDGTGLIPCFGCGRRDFLYRGYCRLCNPKAHYELQENIKNAPSIDVYKVNEK